jgi:hypothetical protein
MLCTEQQYSASGELMRKHGDIAPRRSTRQAFMASEITEAVYKNLMPSPVGKRERKSYLLKQTMFNNFRCKKISSLHDTVGVTYI